VPSILSNEMTPNGTPSFEVVGHVQVGYGIIDDGYLVEVTEFKRNPLKGEKRTETFKVPVSTSGICSSLRPRGDDIRDQISFFVIHDSPFVKAGFDEDRHRRSDD
jgi:hypothetical protein